MKKEKCEAGCTSYAGGEKRHHKDCVFYQGSLSQRYDEMENQLKNLGEATAEPSSRLLDSVDRPCSLCKWNHGKNTMTGIGSTWPCESCRIDNFEPEENDGQC